MFQEHTWGAPTQPKVAESSRGGSLELSFKGQSEVQGGGKRDTRGKDPEFRTEVITSKVQKPRLSFLLSINDKDEMISYPSIHSPPSSGHRLISSASPPINSPHTLTAGKQFPWTHHSFSASSLPTEHSLHSSHQEFPLCRPLRILSTNSVLPWPCAHLHQYP